MAMPRELTQGECEQLISGGAVGRIAVCAPDGPHVVPVNYVVLDSSLVFRTSPYSDIGTYARDAQVAFEVDHIDAERETGWSVQARGRAAAVTSHEEITDIRAAWPSGPWAEGVRNVYLRLRWTQLSGRTLAQLPTSDLTSSEPGSARP